MHNKFLLFCKKDDERVRPYAVWTGSFNLSRNSSKSLENAILITNKDIIWAYYREYIEMLLLSNPIDWDEDYLEPEWRIGS